MKIIFFVTGLNSGGIENYLLRFIRKKHNAFGQIVIFCKGGVGGQLEPQYLEYPNVRIIKKKVGFVNPIDYFNLFSYLKKNKFDVVCDFTGNFSGLILKIASLANITKRVVFYRSSQNRFTPSFFKKIYNDYLKRMTYKNATDILSNSKAAFDYFYPNIWAKEERFKVVYNGITIEDFVGVKDNLRVEFNIPETAFVIGHTGRYNEAKNHSTIIKVAERLINKYDDIYVILCGNGVEKNLKEYLIKRKIEERILVFENRSDIPIFLNTMDLYFFPSITEGQPNALLEAMCMGLPFVASNIAPIQEIVPSEYYKYLAEPMNIEKQIKLLLLLRRGFSNKDKQKLAKYTMDKFNSQDRFQDFLAILVSNLK